MRSEVGRKPCNSAGPGVGAGDAQTQQLEQMQDLLYAMLCVFQWRSWFHGRDMFRVFGCLRFQEAWEPGTANWATVENIPEDVENFDDDFHEDDWFEAEYE